MVKNRFAILLSEAILMSWDILENTAWNVMSSSTL